MIWKLALNHENIFAKEQTVGKISDNELYSPDNSGSGWDNVLLAQKGNKRESCNKDLLVCIFFEKINSRGGGHLLQTEEYLKENGHIQWGCNTILVKKVHSFCLYNDAVVLFLFDDKDTN